MPGQRLCRCLSLPAAASVPLCRSVQGEACEALDGCRAILSRSRCCRLGGADPRSCRSGQTARVGRAAEGAPKGKPRLRGAVSARTGRLCRVNGSAGASLSSCGLCAALPISPGRSLRSPRRVPGNPVPVPVLSARRGRSSVLPVRPDGTGGSSCRRRPEGASPACGAQSRPARDGCAGSTALPVPLSCCGLCAALPISPGRSLRSPRRVPGNPVPVPVLSARRGRSSVLPVRPDGTGGSSRRRRPEGASPACGAQSRPARDGCAGSTALPVPLFLLRPLCRSADQSRAKPAKP